MPLIEELPTAKGSANAPGWAYVPDTGYDPSKAPIIPTVGKRNARAAAIPTGNDVSSRQQIRIAKQLSDLDKENNKEVQIVIPNRPRDVAARGLRGQMTPGVKKILLSQKTFNNYLADEEAMLAIQDHEHRPAKTPVPRTKRVSLPQANSTADAMDVDLPAAVAEPAHRHEDHPLVQPHGPPLPTEAEIEALLAAPPLSYNAARAAPSTSTVPPRQFCEICGYWGRARCMKCGARICGVDCKNQHEETNCQKFWA